MKILDVALQNVDALNQEEWRYRIPDNIEVLLRRVFIGIRFKASLPELYVIKGFVSTLRFWNDDIPPTKQMENLKERYREQFLPLDESFREFDTDAYNEKELELLMPSALSDYNAMAILNGFTIVTLCNGDFGNFFRGDYNANDPKSQDSQAALRVNIVRLFLEQITKSWLNLIVRDRTIINEWLHENPYSLKTQKYFAIRSIYLEGGETNVSFVNTSSEEIDAGLKKLAGEQVKGHYDWETNVFAEIVCYTPIHFFYLLSLIMDKGTIIDTQDIKEVMCIGEGYKNIHHSYPGFQKEPFKHDMIQMENYYETLLMKDDKELDLVQKATLMPGTSMIYYTIILEVVNYRKISENTGRLTRLTIADGSEDVGRELLGLYSNLTEIVHGYFTQR